MAVKKLLDEEAIEPEALLEELHESWLHFCCDPHKQVTNGSR